MAEVNREALNKKLAEWAGWQLKEFKGSFPSWYAPIQNGMALSELPNFTNSLDACFKWLTKGFNGVWWYDFDNGRHTWTFRKKGSETIGEAETPALALCLAIEKLIDSEAISGKAKEQD